VGFWYWLVHWTGSDYGLTPGKWSFYGFWSGFGSDLGEITIIAGLLAVYRKHNCHVRGCLRIARHEFTDEAAGATYMLCRKHHPATADRGLPASRVDLIHARNAVLEGQGPEGRGKR
jgi:hypothetical protein